MKKLLVFITILTCLLSLLNVCNASSQEKGYTKEVIIINDTNAYASCVQLIMRLKGMLEPYLPDNVAVEWTSIASSADIRDAVVANRVDVASMAVPLVIAALENQMPMVVISGTAGSPAYLYSKNSEITSFQDIKSNTRISILSRGSAYHLAFLADCKTYFGDILIYDNNLIIAPNAEVLASLAHTSEFDCAILSLPSTIKANEIDGLTIIEDFTPILLDYNLTSYFVTNEKFYKENPVLIEAFRKATCDAVVFINSHTAEAALLLGKAYDVDPVYVEEALLTCPPRVEVSGYDRIADLMYEAGILSETPVKFIDLSYYNEIPKADE